jgi:YfiH family protein
VFYEDAQHVYRVRALDAFPWLLHGFGTRHSQAWGANAATLHQIHSGIIVDAAGRSGGLGDGDALIENTPGCSVAVKSADCVPILLVDERRRAVAAVHAGWRGASQKIVQKAADAMVSRFSSEVADLHAAIGPAIGKCCYEVGAEVASQFGLPPQRAHLDLAQINQQHLIAHGIAPERIYLAGLCTKCLEKDFYSWRRDGERAGRMLSVAGIR